MSAWSHFTKLNIRVVFFCFEMLTIFWVPRILASTLINIKMIHILTTPTPIHQCSRRMVFSGLTTTVWNRSRFLCTTTTNWRHSKDFCCCDASAWIGSIVPWWSLSLWSWERSTSLRPSLVLRRFSIRAPPHHPLSLFWALVLTRPPT